MLKIFFFNNHLLFSFFKLQFFVIDFHNFFLILQFIFLVIFIGWLMLIKFFFSNLQ